MVKKNKNYDCCKVIYAIVTTTKKLRNESNFHVSKLVEEIVLIA